MSVAAQDSGERPGAWEGISAARVVPVVVVETATEADGLASALVAGGLKVAEVTFRTHAAIEAIRAMAARGDLLVGAGTVTTVEQADRAVEAGATFVVSPGLNPQVLQRCRQLGIPAFPGVATATEVMRAVQEGTEVVKLFPAEALGGLRMLSALAAPFPGVRFIPTGGIGPDNLAGYLRHPAVLAVGGSWMVAPALVRAHDWEQITRLAAEAVAVADSLPAPAPRPAAGPGPIAPEHSMSGPEGETHRA